MFDLWQCGIFKPKQEKRVVSDNRAEWLIRDILPVFSTYINGHGADSRVADYFLSVIENSKG